MVVEKAWAPEFALHFEALYKFLVIIIIIIADQALKMKFLDYL